MKRFKAEKSRSTLWREACNAAVLQPESYCLVQDDVHFDEVSHPSSDYALTTEQNDYDLSENEGFTYKASDKNVAALDCELGFESNSGWRWLNDEDEDYESESEDSLIRDLALWFVKMTLVLLPLGHCCRILKPHLLCCQKVLILFATLFAIHHI